MAVSKLYPTEQVCKILLCELCDTEEDVNWFCKNCVQNLCDKCKILHMKIPSLQSHDIGSIGDGRVFSERKLCTKHGELIMYLCATCSLEELCLKCAGSKHQKHELKDIIQIAEAEKKELQSLLNEKSAYLSGLTKVRIMIDQKRAESCKGVEEARKLITGRFKTITQIKDALMVALSNQENKLKLQLNKEEDVLENMESRLKSEMESVRGNMNIATGAELLKFISIATLRLNDITLPSMMQLPSPSIFNENSNITLTSEHLFGELKSQLTTKVDVLGIADRQGGFAITYRHDLHILTKILSRTFGFKFIFDILVFEDGRAWITGNTNDLQMIDEDGKVFKNINMKPIVNHLALSPNGEILVSHGVTDVEGNNVLKIVHNDSSYSDFLDLSQYHYVYGLCCTGNLSVVCVVKDYKSNYFVLKQNQKGETKWKLPLDDVKTYKLFVRADHHGNFFFKTSSGLCFVNEKGRTVREASLGLDMTNVGPVEIDRFDNFLVGTRNGKIFVYDTYFQVQRKFHLSEEERQIYSLAFGKEDKLWISTYSGRVFVTRYLE